MVHTLRHQFYIESPYNDANTKAWTVDVWDETLHGVSFFGHQLNISWSCIYVCRADCSCGCERRSSASNLELRHISWLCSRIVAMSALVFLLVCSSEWTCFLSLSSCTIPWRYPAHSLIPKFFCQQHASLELLALGVTSPCCLPFSLSNLFPKKEKIVFRVLDGAFPSVRRVCGAS